MKKINVAEILKNCPEGMKLDCTIWDDVEFREIDAESDTIILRVGNKFIRRLDKYGQEDSVDCAKCVIFPKDETTWEGFHRPFINGDVIVDKYGAVALYKRVHSSYEEPYVDFHCGITSEYRRFFLKDDNSLQHCGKIDSIRFATEEEKEELFQAIKEHGYKWNEETKTLEKRLIEKPKFENGDIIFTHANCLKVGLGNTWISIFQEKRNGGVATYVDYAEDGSDIYLYNEDKGLLCMDKDIMRQRFATEEEKQKLFDAIKANGYKWNSETKTLEKLPKFKVGDRIKYINGKNKDGVKEGIILSITNDTYDVAVTNDMGIFVPISEQDNWELAPNKFDITTLKPFDKVLVRDKSNEVWTANFYSHYDATSDKPFICVGWSEMNEYRYCIPYDVNKELLGTTNNSEEQLMQQD